MKLIKQIIPIAIIITLMTSCASSRIVLSSNADVSKYKYVIFGSESSGDRELDDIIMAVQNEIAATKLTVVSAQEGFAKVALGESVLTPNIHVSTEKWNGGHTYITITFYDYDTGQSIAVLKSSGIGLSISQDQNIALRTIRKNLKNVF